MRPLWIRHCNIYLLEPTDHHTTSGPLEVFVRNLFDRNFILIERHPRQVCFGPWEESFVSGLFTVLIYRKFYSIHVLNEDKYLFGTVEFMGNDKKLSDIDYTTISPAGEPDVIFVNRSFNTVPRIDFCVSNFTQVENKSDYDWVP